ncbi:tetratricopeptide repeat protein [Marinobacter sp. ATCH36]|uniref:tetratricopeptide repeat protein n=1 Tax=Marinobacter sp. ATCH36 TaxID=2945106 RepID=UPI0020226286|nr:tetratricopeptide repeat protein [Marinobacter sp. ATCH36]MCL7946140.1 tetratricopeptide repeat protein [Marinobacter sp. ATCH36]
MRPSKLATFFIALTILSPASMAEERAGNADFEAGVAAFGAGELTAARIHFEQARADGLDTPSLLYNLGVVYFRLGQHDFAESVFLELLGTPHAPLARYNLGLVMQEQGRYEAARQWFEQAAGPDSPEKVRALAFRQLDETQTSQFDDIDRNGYLAAAAGYDDNIAGTPDDASSNQAGTFADLLATGNLHFDNGVSLLGVAYTRQYPDNAEFDNSYLSTGAAWRKGIGEGELTSTLSLAGSWFGADALERELRLEAVYRPDNCAFGIGAYGYDCSVDGSVSTIQGGSGFSAYDGEMLRLGAGAEKGVGNWVFIGRYQFELNDRRDLTAGEQFVSVSPLRNLLSAEARYYVSARLSLSARGDYRHSRYKDEHRLLSGADVISERRTDHRLRGVLLAQYQLTGPWLVLAELSMVNNRSTIERYDYNRREAMVGIEMGF